MAALNKGIYKHFKHGALYVVIGRATHTETGEELVLYYNRDNPDKLWARPREMWDEVVTHPVTGDSMPRFQRVL